MKSECSQNDKISSKLDVLIKLVAAIATEGKKPREQIAFLSKCGLEIGDISSITGKTKSNVSSLLHLSKRGPK